MVGRKVEKYSDAVGPKEQPDKTDRRRACEMGAFRFRTLAPAPKLTYANSQKCQTRKSRHLTTL
jgi:hypothetical protein